MIFLYYEFADFQGHDAISLLDSHSIPFLNFIIDGVGFGVAEASVLLHQDLNKQKKPSRYLSMLYLNW